MEELPSNGYRDRRESNPQLQARDTEALHMLSQKGQPPLLYIAATHGNYIGATANRTSGNRTHGFRRTQTEGSPMLSCGGHATFPYSALLHVRRGTQRVVLRRPSELLANRAKLV